MSAASAGACLGFLVWNFHPAKVFMGDTGSLFLGGLVCALAFAIDMPILLIRSELSTLLRSFPLFFRSATSKSHTASVFSR